MAAKIKSKGCSVLVEISSVYTAIPSLEGFTVDGNESETFEIRTLDQTRYLENQDNGYSKPPTLNLDYMWDPANVVHIVLDALPAAGTAKNFKTTYTDSGPKSIIYAGVGYKETTTVAAADAVKKSFVITTSGAPT